jgi:hypothetical protein
LLDNTHAFGHEAHITLSLDKDILAELLEIEIVDETADVEGDAVGQSAAPWGPGESHDRDLTEQKLRLSRCRSIYLNNQCVTTASNCVSFAVTLLPALTHLFADVADEVARPSWALPNLMVNVTALFVVLRDLTHILTVTLVPAGLLRA